MQIAALSHPSKHAMLLRQPSHSVRRLARSSACTLATAVGLLAALARGAGTQAVVPQGAPRDMSRVALRDSTLFPPIITREFRGAWLSPAADGDWPSRPGLSAEQQQRELIALLEHARIIGLNAIIFHVRLSGDALYSTPLAPWSAKLTGRQGVNPGYDPLAVAIREAHARGLQVHAWFNPFRASLDGGIRAARNHVTRTHPEWVRRYGRQQWIDPGTPAAREAVLATIIDVVHRYDIDGVHLDDFFYPYRETRTRYRRVGRGRHRHTIKIVRELDFPDRTSWLKYGRREHWTSRDDWRRHNIDDFVAELYKRVHVAKPWVAVGISPFGIWRPGYPEGIDGLDSFRETYADSRRWLREGWLDYIAPQLYWPLDNDQQRFTRLDTWWRGENVHGRHLWPGLFTMRVGSRDDPWPAREIAQEVQALRDARRGTNESLGHVHFRLRTFARRLEGDTATFGDELRDEIYGEPALPPASPWLGDTTPAAPILGPSGRGVQQAGAPGDDLAEPPSAVALTVMPGDSVAVRWWLVQTLGSDGRWHEQLHPATAHALALTLRDIADASWVAVTAISRTGVAGAPTIVSVN